jgi:hypothetical protein
MESVCRWRVVALVFLCALTLLAGPGAAGEKSGIVGAESVGFGECGPGYCVEGSFCDDCACYAPEAPISQVACRCRLIDPTCGIGECVNGSAYCEGPFCPAPVCYAPTSPVSQVLCQGAELGEDCKVKPKGCGPGYCVGDSFCDDCACYAPWAPISQVACRCRLMDPACGIGECVGNGAYCEGPFCPAPVCYTPTNPISQVLCAGGTLGRDCKLNGGVVVIGDDPPVE